MSITHDVLTEINEVMAEVSEQQLVQALPYFHKERRIFVIGAGRSGFQAKVMGETITPAIKAGDTG